MAAFPSVLRRCVTLAALLAALSALAGCGSDEGPSTSRAKKPARPNGNSSKVRAAARNPERAFLAFQTALADGDAATACGLLGPAALKQVERASRGGKCTTWVAEVAGKYGARAKAKLKRTKVAYVEEFAGMASIKYTSSALKRPLKVELQKSRTGWRITRLAENV